MNSPIGWAAPSARFEFASDFPTPAASNSFAAHGLEIPPDTGISNFATLFALDASPNPSSTPPAQVHGLYRHARRHLPSRDLSIALGLVLVGVLDQSYRSCNRRRIARPRWPCVQSARAGGAHTYHDQPCTAGYRDLTPQPRLRCQMCAPQAIAPGSIPPRGESRSGPLQTLAGELAILLRGTQLNGGLGDLRHPHGAS